MYLLNIRELRLEYFIGDHQIPPYFILSHTWGDDEVTYQDVRNLPPKALVHRKGWKKIQGFCQMLLTSKEWLASDDGFYKTIKYVWVDTCCINKESSAELSEAINSMYRWYQRAAACIVYLEDVSHFAMQSDHVSISRWFTRGWTLQELLAPNYVVLYNCLWTMIGSRAVNAELISKITHIHTKFLDGSAEVAVASTSEKMSWASKRKTTRSEDIAYCLMGLFDINMPLLYGEGGEKAFIRLQEEILKDSTDESIFAWDASDEPGGAGMLATHPSRFVNGSEIVALGSRKNPQAVKNGGILMTAGCFPIYDGTAYRVVLDCGMEDMPREFRIMIDVLKTSDCRRTQSPYRLESCSVEGERPKDLFFVKRRPPAPVSAQLQRWEVYWYSDKFTLLEAWPAACWSEAKGIRDDWGPGPLEERLSRRQYCLDLRRAKQLAQEAGQVREEALTALALCPKNHPQEVFVLFMSVEPRSGTFKVKLANMRGQSFPTLPEDFKYSHHWLCISGLIEAWGNGKDCFKDFHDTVIQTASCKIEAVGVPVMIDRRKGVEVHVYDELRETSKKRKVKNTLPKNIVPSEPMQDVPLLEYWEPYYKEPKSRRPLAAERRSAPFPFSLERSSKGTET